MIQIGYALTYAKHQSQNQYFLTSAIPTIAEVKIDF